MSEVFFLDLGAKFAFVAFFTTAGTTLAMGIINRRHERRKVLKEQLEKIVADYAVTLPVLLEATPASLVYDDDLRGKALELLVDLRRACLNATHRDCDACLKSTVYHRLASFTEKCRPLIEIVQRTSLEVSETPVWNGQRKKFAQPVLRAFNVSLTRPK